MIPVEYLLEHSHLPGPRGNLELLHAFAREADEATVTRCLACIAPDTANSPEEFAGMCGILGYAWIHRARPGQALSFLRPYARHSSWRIREAVAMGIQALAEGRMSETIPLLASWIAGDGLEQRAVVAGLCEPGLLREEKSTAAVLAILETITRRLAHDSRLTADEVALRKALGYGWSVAVVAFPEEGQKRFEALFVLPGRHVRWILKENLGKNRLARMDRAWAASCVARLTPG